MTDTRLQLLDALAKLSDQHSEMRLGQLIAFITMLARGPGKGAVYDATDEELLRAAEEHLRTQAGAEVAIRAR